jgi:hypothetical protein
MAQVPNSRVEHPKGAPSRGGGANLTVLRLTGPPETWGLGVRWGGGREGSTIFEVQKSLKFCPKF